MRTIVERSTEHVGIAFFVAMLLWPSHFALFAWIFAALCVATALQRAASAVRQFR